MHYHFSSIIVILKYAYWMFLYDEYLEFSHGYPLITSFNVSHMIASRHDQIKHRQYKLYCNLYCAKQIVFNFLYTNVSIANV